MTTRRHIKYIPSDYAAWLRKNHTALYLLLSLAIENARWHKEPSADGLLQGDAILGSYDDAGISRQQYRDAIIKGCDLGLWEVVYNAKDKKTQKRTIKRTIKSIVVNIKDSSVWDLNFEGRTNKITIKEPTGNQQVPVAYIDKESEESKESEAKETAPPLKASPKEKDVATLLDQVKACNLGIPDSEIYAWIKKHGFKYTYQTIERCTNERNLRFADGPARYVQSALNGNYFGIEKG